MSTAPPVLEVDRLSKRFTRELRRSLRYAATDIAREVTARTAPPDGRPLRRGEFAALDEVSFTLEPGDSLALIGANGAGKSTLLKLLYGLIKPDGGEIHVRGRVAALIELGTGFDPVLTGRENIAVNAAIVGLPVARLREVTDEVVAFSELRDTIDAPVRTYSSGMVARLAFAVAAHVEPDVLLIDEVFAVGDNAFQRKCVRHLQGFLQRGGSLVLVSHNTYQIQSTCRRGLLLERGRCTFAGTVAETLNRYLAVQAQGTTGRQGVAGSARAPDSRHPVVIDRLTVSSASGQALRTGEPVRVEVSYRSLEATVATWGFSVWTGDGWVCVTGAYDVRPTPLHRGAGALACTIPRLPLLNGRYAMRAAIVEAETLQALAVHGYEEMPQQFVVETSASPLHNSFSTMNQLVTLDVDWH